MKIKAALLASSVLLSPCFASAGGSHFNPSDRSLQNPTNVEAVERNGLGDYMAYQQDRRRNVQTLYVDPDYVNDVRHLPPKQAQREMQKWGDENYRISNSSTNPLKPEEMDDPLLKDKKAIKEMKAVNQQLAPYVDENVTAREETMTDPERRARLNTADKRRLERIKREMYTQDRSVMSAFSSTENGRISPFSDPNTNGSLVYRHDSGRISTFDKYTPQVQVPVDTPDIYRRADMQVRRPSININAFDDAPIASSSRHDTPRVDAFAKPITTQDKTVLRERDVYNPENGRVNAFSRRQRDENMRDLYQEADPVTLKPFH